MMKTPILSSVPDSPKTRYYRIGQLWRIGRRFKIDCKNRGFLMHRRIVSFFHNSKNIIMANALPRAGLYSLRSPSL